MTGPSWGRWQQQLLVSHIDPSCELCLFAGPLLERFGTTVRAAQRGRRVVQPSRIGQGQRLRSVSEYRPGGPVRSHYAVRCPSCGVERVYLLASFAPWGQMTEIESMYRPPDFERRKHMAISEAEIVRRAVVREDGSHRYMSTYCLDGDHENCRLTCKNCGELCVCDVCAHAGPLPAGQQVEK